MKFTLNNVVATHTAKQNTKCKKKTENKKRNGRKV